MDHLQHPAVPAQPVEQEEAKNTTSAPAFETSRLKRWTQLLHFQRSAALRGSATELQLPIGCEPQILQR